MKKNLFLLTLATLLCFASCDKIDADADGYHHTFSGSIGTWEDGNGVSNKAQRIFLEKYTGPHCPNCPNADVAITAAMEAYGEQFIPIAIHDSGAFGRPYDGSPDLRTADGDAWSKYFGIAEYPRALANRIEASFDPQSGINSHVDAILQTSPSVALAVSNTTNEGNCHITVDLEFLKEVQGPLTLTLLVIEDGIVAKQQLPDGSVDPNYVHNHVLRDVITDLWGMDIDADGKTGTKRKCVIPFTANADWNWENCHIVAFVSKKANKQILNVAECEF